MDPDFSPILREKQDRFPWRPRSGDVVRIVFLFVLIRLLLVGVGVLSWSHQFPPSKSNWRGIDHRSGIRYALVADQPFLDMWTRWDSWEYEEIARKGYWYDFNHQPRPYGTVACFPLYPLMMSGLGSILGGRYVLAGLIVSNLSAILGILILFQWASCWGDRRSAWLAISAAMAFPTGVFWSALYPQSLYFALSVGSLAMMYDGRTAVACVLTALATATRAEGVALIPALLAIRISRTGWRPTWRDLWFLAAPLGLLAYMIYLRARWGDPVLFLKVHQLFDRNLTNPILTLMNPSENGGKDRNCEVVGTYLVLILLVFGHFTRVRRPILLYGWLLFLIPLASGVYTSIYRVHMVNPAIYLVVGLGFRGRWRFLGWAMVAVCGVFELISMSLWVIGYLLP